MTISDHIRPDPDLLLRNLRAQEEKARRGKLKIFFGMCAGVGKTYDMLKSAQDDRANGIDIVVGFVETHGRKETEALLAGLEIIPRKKVEYRNVTLEEMDLDAILLRKPAIVLVDELAHTNVPGSRHTKRYQDVLELLDNGISVYTTVNVQHLESRADTVAQITGSVMRETVPDSIFDSADEVEIIDIPPDELRRRLAEGKVYTPERSRQAVENFFQKGHLTALREMSLRMTAERVDHQLRDYMVSQQIAGPWKSGQRLLVGISPSPESVKLIRWARRMAYTMNATWIAAYVDQSKPLSKSASAQLEKNFKLARELGAEVFTTTDLEIDRALLRLAHQENATQMLIGKSTFSPFFWRKSLLDKLIEQSGDLDIYIVGGEHRTEATQLRSLLPHFRSGWSQYWIAAAVVLTAATLLYPFTGIIGYQTVAFVLLFAIALLPLKMEFGPVFLAAALSALVWDYFFIPPLYTFSIGSVEDRLMLLAYFIVAIITGVLSARSRGQERAVRAREQRAVALYSLTKDLSVATAQSDVIRSAIANIRKFFGVEVIFYPGEPDGDLSATPHPDSTFTIDEKEFGVVAWVYWNEKSAGKFTETLPFAQATYYPLSGPRYTLGVIGIKPHGNEKLSLEQESLLENFIRQTASTLDRELLHEVNRKTIVIEESERLYKNLFNSISHELRTPIASIMGAADGLLNDDVSRRLEIRQELSAQIRSSAERLNRLVENLLNMTRIESGRIQPVADWVDLNDLVTLTRQNIGKELAGRPVTVNIPADMPLLKLDFGLMEQALVNILHNISQYTPPSSPIQIDAAVSAASCVLIIADRGPGLPPEALEKVFEKFYRVPGTKAGGTGLGLSIAKGFVEAHRGTLAVENRPDGGTRFIITLPVPPREPGITGSKPEPPTMGGQPVIPSTN